MIRLFHAYFPIRTVLLVVTDTVFIVAGLLATNLIWSYARGGQSEELLSSYAKVAAVSFVVAMCLYYYDLYESEVASNLREVATRLIQVLGTACVVLALLYYAYPEMQLGRGVLITGILLTGGGLVICRRLFLVVNCSPNLTDRALFLGSGSLTVALSEELRKRPELGVQAIGYADECQEEALGNVRRMGNLSDLDALVRGHRVNRIIVAMQDRRGRLPLEALLELKNHGVRIEDGTRLYEEVTGRVSIDSLRLSSLVFSTESHPSKVTLAYKRIFSMFASAVALVILSPVLILIAIAIRIDSKGPVIFRQKRVGKNGELFTLVKFRSMWVNADSDKPAEANDVRMTRVGRLLRRTRLDEIPQLYNIFRGDIDFVGPRPFVPAQEEELVAKIPFYNHRWAVRPGATGWAQVHRGYCATLEDNIEKLGYDIFYIQNMSVGLDLLILFQTLKILVLGRGAR